MVMVNNLNMKRFSSILLAASLFLSACNLPNAEAETAVATAAAQTIEAALSQAAPLASQTAAAESSASLTQPAQTESAAGSSSTPFASFEDVTNCRTGPGVDYERITQITPGLAVEIVGFYPPNYWVVSTDKGLCWVAGEFVTPSGNYAAVPTVTAPPTPTGDALENVSLQKWDIFCNFATNEADITIRWADLETETGYRVVRNDVIIAELTANTTEFQETINLVSGQSVGYYIIAYNNKGPVNSKVITLSC